MSRYLLLAGLVTLLHGSVSAQAPGHGQRPAGRLAIRNALVLEGNGTPATGPWDIVLEGNRIADMVPLDAVALKAGRQRRPEAATETDAAGRFVLPGLINLHSHLQNERGGIPQPYEYQFKLWLASGITTVRDVSSGADPREFLSLKTQSEQGKIEAPRIFVCAGYTRRPTPQTPAEARARVQDLTRQGVDCIKFGGMDRVLMEPIVP